MESPHLHHGFKPATPVEEAFARAKRRKLRSEPLALRAVSTGFLVTGWEAAQIVLGRKVGRGEATAFIRSLNVLPRSRLRDCHLYSVEDVREEYRRRKWLGRV